MDDCKALFARLRDATDDLTPILNTIGHELTESTKERIADEKKSPEGLPWPDYVKPNYAALKRSGIKRKKSAAGVNDWILEPSGGGLLEHAGNLLQSITYNVSSNEVNVGSNEEYARRHQKGGDGIQARAYLGISEADANAINKFIRDALDAN